MIPSRINIGSIKGKRKRAHSSFFVFNDQAFIDMLWNLTDPGHVKMMERVDRQEGRHITEYTQCLGLGTTDYELINID